MNNNVFHRQELALPGGKPLVDAPQALGASDSSHEVLNGPNTVRTPLKTQATRTNDWLGRLGTVPDGEIDDNASVTSSMITCVASIPDIDAVYEHGDPFTSNTDPSFLDTDQIIGVDVVKNDVLAGVGSSFEKLALDEGVVDKAKVPVSEYLFYRSCCSNNDPLNHMTGMGAPQYLTSSFDDDLPPAAPPSLDGEVSTIVSECLSFPMDAFEKPMPGYSGIGNESLSHHDHEALFQYSTSHSQDFGEFGGSHPQATSFCNDDPAFEATLKVHGPQRKAKEFSLSDHQDFLNNLDRGFQIWCAGRQGSTAQSPSAVDSSEAGPSQNKRKRTVKKDADEDLDGLSLEVPQISKRRRRVEDSQSPPRLACHFSKQNVWRHLSCLHHGSKKMSHIKQHMDRQHHRHYCPTCHATFEVHEDCDSHIASRLCQRRDIPGVAEYVTDRHDEQYENATRRNTSDETKWFQLWDILYPGCAQPASCYTEQAHIVIIANVDQYFRTSGAAAIEEHLREWNNQLPSVEHVQMFATELIDRQLSTFSRHAEEQAAQSQSSASNSGDNRSTFDVQTLPTSFGVTTVDDESYIDPDILNNTEPAPSGPSDRLRHYAADNDPPNYNFDQFFDFGGAGAEGT